MSGLRPIEFDLFYRRLHGRGLDTAALAKAVGRTRSTVTRVLNGSRRKGPVWRKLEAILTAEELKLLHVAQCSPWNKARVAKQPRWSDSVLNAEQGRVAA